MDFSPFSSFSAECRTLLVTARLMHKPIPTVPLYLYSIMQTVSTFSSRGISGRHFKYYLFSYYLFFPLPPSNPVNLFFTGIFCRQFKYCLFFILALFFFTGISCRRFKCYLFFSYCIFVFYQTASTFSSRAALVDISGTTLFPPSGSLNLSFTDTSCRHFKY